MAMDVLIRKASAKDLGEIQKLGTELMVSERRFEPSYKEKWYFSEEGTKYLLKGIRGRGHICFVAESDNRLVGYASCSIITDDTARTVNRAELDNLVVSEQYRSQGVGHKLAGAFKQWAKTKGATKLKVDVNAHNAGAIDFYKDIGFSDHQLTMEADI
jgi:ribosomal protein S18 acetylase RimI-like enzyme